MKQKLKIRPGANGFAFLAAEPLRRIVPHHHDELEVNLVLTGRASYLFGDRRVPLPAHSMIWLFPRQEHVLIDWSHDFSMWVLVFRPELVRQETWEGDRRILRSADPGEIFCRQIAARQIDALCPVYQGASDGRDDLEFLNAALGYALVASWQAYQFSREPIPLSAVHPAVAKAARLLSAAQAALLTWSNSASPDDQVALNAAVAALVAYEAGLPTARVSGMASAAH